MSNMISPDLISQALKQAEAAKPEPAATPSAPNAADQQKFEAALNTQPPQGVESIQPPQAAAAPESVNATPAIDGQTKAPGDTILDQMHKISHDLAHDNKFVHETLKSMGTEAMNPEEMLKLQYHLAQMSTDTALTTSIASDVKKGITTLMNNQ